MRRPEIEGFISVSPPANMYDFAFLAPCPSSGLVLQGTEDDVVPEPSVEKLANKLKMQKNITIDYQLIKGANHFYKAHMDQMVDSVSTYLDMRMNSPNIIPARRKSTA
jgi:alpha/beta superfamily hydrolase